MLQLCEYIYLLLYLRGGMGMIEVVRERYSSAVKSVLEDADTEIKNVVSSIDRKFSLHIQYEKNTFQAQYR